MTDLSILSHIKTTAVGSTTEAITTVLGQLGEIFTQWHEHTRVAPSLRQVGHDLLSQLLPGSSVVNNPDVLFINTSSADRSLARSHSLTDALLHALTHGLVGHEGDDLGKIVLTVVALSIVIHGITTTPLMNWRGHALERAQHEREARDETGFRK